MPAIPSPPRAGRVHIDPAALVPADFERYLLDHSATIAPADVTALVARAGELRRRLTSEKTMHPALAQRATVALHLLADHVQGACPQIPLHTVSLLTTALLYYLAPMDVIPDFIPRIGTADDALVLDVTWRLASPGVRRYLDWKSLTPPETEPIRAARAPAAAPKKPKAAARKAARAKAAKPAPRRR